MPASFNALYPPLSFFMDTIMLCNLILFDQSQIFLGLNGGHKIKGFKRKGLSAMTKPITKFNDKKDFVNKKLFDYLCSDKI